MQPSGARPIASHALLLAGTVIVLAPASKAGLMLYDLGELVFFVDKLSEGARPGLDFAVNAYGPGRYLLVDALFESYGRSFVVLSAALLGVQVLIASLAYEAGRRLLPAPWFLVPVLCLWAAPGPLHKGFYLAGTLGLLIGLMHYLERPGPLRALVYGGVLAAVALFRLDLGAFGALALFFACAGARERWRDLALGVLPLSLGLLGVYHQLHGIDPAAPAAVWTQILDDAWKNQSIIYPRMPGWAELSSLSSPDPWLMWLPLPVYAGLGLLLGRAMEPNSAVPIRRRRALAALLVLGILSCNQLRMKPELGHLLQAGPLLWLAWTVLFQSVAAEAWSQRKEGLFWACLLAVLVLPALLAWNTSVVHRGDLYTGGFTLDDERTEKLSTPLGRARLNVGEKAELEPLLDFLRDEVPPGPLWVPTNQPLYYSLSGRRDVTGYVGVLYYAGSASAQEQLLLRLETHKPPVAVFVDDSIEGPERRLGRAAPAVHAYLFRTYRTVHTFGRNRVMLRRPGR